MLLRVFVWLSISFYAVTAYSQCINTFPYTEDFEATNGNWVSGGSGNDWAWGAVSKNVIAQAAGGANCWVTGGLTNSFYNLGEQSYVQSPCFDFSTLTQPYIRFKILWETENGYDGAGFQYSIDGGTTWQNVGAYNPIQCEDNGWFNTDNVTYLNGFTAIRHGWSGNVQQSSGSCAGGRGSQGWRNASQCMPYLAGQPDVRFRFIFGAGTQCNNYDGVAFDEIYISNAPVPDFDFTYRCNGDFITIEDVINPVGFDCYDSIFISIDGTLLSIATGGLVSFSRNVAVPDPGIAPQFPHTVSLLYRGDCHPDVTITKRIADFDYQVSATPSGCAGSNSGQAIVTFNSGTLPGTITWNSTPAQQNDTAYNLPAGNYYALLSDAFGCSVNTNTVTVAALPPIVAAITAITADTCNKQTGSITTSIDGSNPPYQYAWSNGSTAPNISTLPQGNYSVTITDGNNCTISLDTTIVYESGLTLGMDADNVPCRQTTGGKVTAIPEGGSSPYTYSWSNNAATAVIADLPAGMYTVTVTDAIGCSISAQLPVLDTYCPSFVYFPTGFSPNGDGVNDVFRARFSDDLDKFNLQVYNRWGELVFESNNKLDGWNGIYKGIAQPLSVYTWVARYNYIGGKTETQSGNITLVR
jgi:gliding motility-associated-like protein